MKERIASMHRQLDVIMSEIEQLDAEMSGQGMDPVSSSEYVVHFF